MSKWQSKFALSSDAKKAGWFSRRHETDGPHRAAQDAWREQRLQREIREETVRVDSELRKVEERRRREALSA